MKVEHTNFASVFAATNLSSQPSEGIQSAGVDSCASISVLNDETRFVKLFDAKRVLTIAIPRRDLPSGLTITRKQRLMSYTLLLNVVFMIITSAQC